MKCGFERTNGTNGFQAENADGILSFACYGRGRLIPACLTVFRADDG